MNSHFLADWPWEKLPLAWAIPMNLSMINAAAMTGRGCLWGYVESNVDNSNGEQKRVPPLPCFKVGPAVDTHSDAG